MDRRLSKTDRRHRLASAEGRTATVLEVRRHSLLVQCEGVRFKLASAPERFRDHWVGQRIEWDADDILSEAELLGRQLPPSFFATLWGDGECGPGPSSADPGHWAGLQGKPHGTLVEGRVVQRRRGSVCVDLGQGGLVPIGPDQLIGSVYRRYGEEGLPDVGAALTLSFHGFLPDGRPRLHVRPHERDPRYRSFDAGYRSRYRGEDGPFAVLPWERGHRTPGPGARSRGAKGAR